MCHSQNTIALFTSQLNNNSFRYNLFHMDFATDSEDLSSINPLYQLTWTYKKGQAAIFLGEVT